MGTTATPGQFIQLGVSPPAADGYGEFVTVEKLEALEKQRVRDKLANLHADLLEMGIAAMRAKTKADADVEEVRRQLHLAVGGDGIRAGFAMMADEAAKQSAAERAQAAKPVAKR